LTGLWAVDRMDLRFMNLPTATRMPTPHAPSALRCNIAITLALIGLVFLLACGSSGQAARDFEVVQFNGDTFRLSDEVKTQAVVLNFWYPSCPPCREEMPAFEAAWQELKDEPVRFLALYVPQGIDTEEDARDFIEEFGLTFNFATDRLARIAEAYELQYFPKTYFINKDGDIVATHISTLETEEIIKQVRALLGDATS
jgi:peroxiredoxin